MTTFELPKLPGMYYQLSFLTPPEGEAKDIHTDRYRDTIKNDILREAIDAAYELGGRIDLRLLSDDKILGNKIETRVYYEHVIVIESTAGAVEWMLRYGGEFGCNQVS